MKLENNQVNSKRAGAISVTAKKRVSTTTAPREGRPNVLTLKVDASDSAMTQAENIAKHVVTVAEVNATTAIEAWSNHQIGRDLHIVTLLEKVEAQTAAVQGGDMSDVEAMLVGQALTLQTIFTALARKGAQNLGTNAAGMELCLRLAFKAQSQCRATLETLAEVKNPRTATFIKQANLAGGHQQVNYGTPATESRPHEKTTDQPNELLTDERAKHAKPMDGRTTGKAVKRDSRVEAVGKGHRAAHTFG